MQYIAIDKVIKITRTATIQDMILRCFSLTGFSLTSSLVFFYGFFLFEVISGLFSSISTMTFFSLLRLAASLVSFILPLLLLLAPDSAIISFFKI